MAIHSLALRHSVATCLPYAMPSSLCTYARYVPRHNQYARY